LMKGFTQYVSEGPYIGATTARSDITYNNLGREVYYKEVLTQEGNSTYTTRYFGAEAKSIGSIKDKIAGNSVYQIDTVSDLNINTSASHPYVAYGEEGFLADYAEVTQQLGIPMTTGILNSVVQTRRSGMDYNGLGQVLYYKDTTISSAAPDKVSLREFGVDSSGTKTAPVYKPSGQLDEYRERTGDEVYTTATHRAAMAYDGLGRLETYTDAITQKAHTDGGDVAYTTTLNRKATSYFDNGRLESYTETATTGGVSTTTTLSVAAKTDYDDLGRMKKYTSWTADGDIPAPLTDANFAIYNNLNKTERNSMTYDLSGRVSTFTDELTQRVVTDINTDGSEKTVGTYKTTRTKRLSTGYDATTGQLSSYKEEIKALDPSGSTVSTTYRLVDGIQYDPVTNQVISQHIYEDDSSAISQTAYDTKTIRSDIKYDAYGRIAAYKDDIYQMNVEAIDGAGAPTDTNSRLSSTVERYETQYKTGTNRVDWYKDKITSDDLTTYRKLELEYYSTGQMKKQTTYEGGAETVSASDNDTMSVRENVIYDECGRMYSYKDTINQKSQTASDGFTRYDTVVERASTSYYSDGRVDTYTETAKTGGQTVTATETVTNYYYSTGQLKGFTKTSVQAGTDTDTGRTINLTQYTTRSNIIYDTDVKQTYYKDVIESSAENRVLKTTRYFGAKISDTADISALTDSTVEANLVKDAPLYENGRLKSYTEVVNQYGTDGLNTLDLTTQTARSGMVYYVGTGQMKYYVDTILSSAAKDKVITRYFGGKLNITNFSLITPDVTTWALYDARGQLKSYTESVLETHIDPNQEYRLKVATVTERQNTDYNTLGQMVYYADTIQSSSTPDKEILIYFGDYENDYTGNENLVMYAANGRMERYAQYAVEKHKTDPAKLNTWTRTVRSDIDSNNLGLTEYYKEAITSSSAYNTMEDVEKVIVREFGVNKDGQIDAPLYRTTGQLDKYWETVKECKIAPAAAGQRAYPTTDLRYDMDGNEIISPEDASMIAQGVATAAMVQAEIANNTGEALASSATYRVVASGADGYDTLGRLIKYQDKVTSSAAANKETTIDFDADYYANGLMHDYTQTVTETDTVNSKLYTRTVTERSIGTGIVYNGLGQQVYYEDKIRSTTAESNKTTYRYFGADFGAGKDIATIKTRISGDTNVDKTIEALLAADPALIDKNTTTSYPHVNYDSEGRLRSYTEIIQEIDSGGLDNLNVIVKTARSGMEYDSLSQARYYKDEILSTAATNKKTTRYFGGKLDVLDLSAAVVKDAATYAAYNSNGQIESYTESVMEESIGDSGASLKAATVTYRSGIDYSAGLGQMEGYTDMTLSSVTPELVTNAYVSDMKYNTKGQVTDSTTTTTQTNILVTATDSGTNFGITTGYPDDADHLNIAGKYVSFDIKDSDNFTFYIKVDTINVSDGTDGGDYYIYYTPQSGSPTLSGGYVHIPIGTDKADGEWHTITRNLDADLNSLLSGKNVTNVKWICIRGDYELSNLAFSNSEDMSDSHMVSLDQEDWRRYTADTYPGTISSSAVFGTATTTQRTGITYNGLGQIDYYRDDITSSAAPEKQTTVHFGLTAADKLVTYYANGLMSGYTQSVLEDDLNYADDMNGDNIYDDLTASTRTTRSDILYNDLGRMTYYKDVITEKSGEYYLDTTRYFGARVIPSKDIGDITNGNIGTMIEENPTVPVYKQSGELESYTEITHQYGVYGADTLDATQQTSRAGMDYNSIGQVIYYKDTIASSAEPWKETHRYFGADFAAGTDVSNAIPDGVYSIPDAALDKNTSADHPYVKYNPRGQLLSYTEIVHEASTAEAGLGALKVVTKTERKDMAYNTLGQTASYEDSIQSSATPDKMVTSSMENMLYNLAGQLTDYKNTTREFSIDSEAAAMDCDGNYLEIPDPNSALDISGDITIEAWIKPDSFTGGYQTVIDRGHGGHAKTSQYWFGLVSGQIKFFYGDDTANYQVVNSGSFVSVNEWTHIAVTISGNSVKFYKNGEHVSSSSISYARTSRDAPVKIGRRAGYAEYYFDGSIADVAIYSRALTTEQIAKSMGQAERTEENGLRQNLIGQYLTLDSTTATIRNDTAYNALGQMKGYTDMIFSSASPDVAVTRIMSYISYHSTGLMSKYTESSAQMAITNAGFESGLEGWGVSGNAEEVSDSYSGGSAAKVYYVSGTNHSISRRVGKLKGGSTYTVRVMFKAEAGVTGSLFFGDVLAPAYENDVFVKKEGNGEWQELEATVTLSHDDDMCVYVYGNKHGVAPQAGDYVIYDRVQITGDGPIEPYSGGIEDYHYAVTTTQRTGIAYNDLGRMLYYRDIITSSAEPHKITYRYAGSSLLYADSIGMIKTSIDLNVDYQVNTSNHIYNDSSTHMKYSADGQVKSYTEVVQQMDDETTGTPELNIVTKTQRGGATDTDIVYNDLGREVYYKDAIVSTVTSDARTYRYFGAAFAAGKSVSNVIQNDNYTVTGTDIDENASADHPYVRYDSAGRLFSYTEIVQQMDTNADTAAEQLNIVTGTDRGGIAYNLLGQMEAYTDTIASSATPGIRSTTRAMSDITYYANGLMADYTDVTRQESGLVFDGADDYVAVNDSLNLNFGASTDFTLGTWIYLDAYAEAASPGVISYAIYKGDAGGAESGYGLGVYYDGHVYFKLSDSTSSDKSLKGSTKLELHKWYYIVGTADRDGKQKIYINGILDGEKDISSIGNIDCSGSQLQLGRLCGGWRYLDGAIDDVIIYSKVLSEVDIKAKMKNGRDEVGTYKLAAYYSFDDGTATDPMGNHGVLNDDIGGLNVTTTTERSGIEYNSIGQQMYYKDEIESTATPDKVTVREFGKKTEEGNVVETKIYEYQPYGVISGDGKAVTFDNISFTTVQEESCAEIKLYDDWMSSNNAAYYWKEATWELHVYV
ncbi:MAG: hypothetical protein KKG95_08065, partial [Candidatus Omnitrophica bacterium]|nr:hypothetical protein [Candidatus Omnitrophota bacterium]